MGFQLIIPGGVPQAFIEPSPWLGTFKMFERLKLFLMVIPGLEAFFFPTEDCGLASIARRRHCFGLCADSMAHLVEIWHRLWTSHAPLWNMLRSGWPMARGSTLIWTALYALISFL